jgi:hypothetical protein
MAPAVGRDHLSSIEQRMLLNMAGCLLARVDGKSPVEYLKEPQRQHVRELARKWILDPPRSLSSALTTSHQP